MQPHDNKNNKSWIIKEKFPGKRKVVFYIQDNTDMIFVPYGGSGVDFEIYPLSTLHTMKINVTSFTLRYVLHLEFSDNIIKEYYTSKAQEIYTHISKTYKKMFPGQLTKALRQLEVVLEMLRMREPFLSSDELKTLHKEGLCSKVTKCCLHCSFID